jgi:hypothetical protein
MLCKIIAKLRQASTERLMVPGGEHEFSEKPLVFQPLKAPLATL